jgi:hypothetical protein
MTFRVRTVFVLMGCLVASVLSIAPSRAATVRHVATTGSDVGDCSVNPCQTIGYAITQSSSGDTIRIAAGTYVEHVIVDRSLTLVGRGSSKTIIDGSGTGTVIAIGAPTGSLNVSISRVTIQNGLASMGGGISSLPPGSAKNRVTITRSVISGNKATAPSGKAAGGGIYNAAGSIMTISKSSIGGNSATGAFSTCGSSGRSGCNGSGGAIENAGTLTLVRTTVSGNSAVGGGGGVFCHPPAGGSGFPGGNGFGGGIDGSVNVANSTLFGNSATGGNGGVPPGLCGPHRFPGPGGDGHGGGIEASSAVRLVNSTVASNVAIGGSGSTTGSATGGGIHVGSNSVTITNTILATNTATTGPDCKGTVTSGGHNLLGKTASCSGFTGTGTW